MNQFRSYSARRCLSLAAAVVGLLAVGVRGEPFTWTVDTANSIVTTKLTATYSGFSASDSKTTAVAGTFDGTVGLPAFDFSNILLSTSNIGYTTNPTFNLSFGFFFGGATIVTNGLGFAIPGAHNLGFAPTTPSPVALDGSFTQTGNGVEGRGTLTYTGYGVLGSGLGTGTINLLDISPIPADFSGTATQVGSQIRLTLPLALDQTSTQSNGVTLRAQINGTVIANATTTAGGWKTDADGTYATATNWSSGVAPAQSTAIDTAVFGNVITAPRTVTTGVISVRRLIISSAQPYTLKGNITADEGLDVRGGTGHTVTELKGGAMTLGVAAGSSVTINRLTATTSLTKTGDGSVDVANASMPGFMLTAGTVTAYTRFQVTSGTSAFSITGPTSRLALQQAAMLERVYTPGSAASVVEQFRGYLQSGYANGQWNGTGIISPSSLTNPRLAIGYADRDALPASSYGGLPRPSTVVAIVTYAGDADIDFDVDFDDLLRLARGYNQPAVWTSGDFNYDGVTDFNDLLLLAKNYNQTTAPTSAQLAELPASVAGDWVFAQSLVPEPATLSLLMGSALIGVRRRAASAH